MLSSNVAVWIAILSFLTLIVMGFWVVWFGTYSYGYYRGRQTGQTVARWMRIFLTVLSIGLCVWSFVSLYTNDANENKTIIHEEIKSNYGVNLSDEQLNQLLGLASKYDENDFIYKPMGITEIDGTKVILVIDDSDVYHLLKIENGEFVEYK